MTVLCVLVRRPLHDRYMIPTTASACRSDSWTFEANGEQLDKLATTHWQKHWCNLAVTFLQLSAFVWHVVANQMLGA